MRATPHFRVNSLQFATAATSNNGYYHARYYDPALARFVSADSIIPGQEDKAGTPNPQNLNRYSYVTNNPVKNTDPSGHCIFAIADTIACIAVAEALFDAVVVVVGGYLIYDGVSNLATTTTPDTVSSPIDDDDDHGLTSSPVGKLTSRDRNYWKKLGVNPEKSRNLSLGEKDQSMMCILIQKVMSGLSAKGSPMIKRYMQVK